MTEVEELTRLLIEAARGNLLSSEDKESFNASDTLKATR